uniref:Uncharacterized protein n=1 Tax=Lotus japonicus TaxID=34305 RepID=I3T8T6_LOTJA|nr:unknown [Lotus japonicus]
MISYTVLRKIVCSDAFRSVPTTNLCRLGNYLSIQKRKVYSSWTKSFRYLSYLLRSKL